MSSRLFNQNLKWKHVKLCVYDVRNSAGKRFFDNNRNDEFYEFHVISSAVRFSTRNCCSVLCTQAQHKKKKAGSGVGVLM